MDQYQGIPVLGVDEITDNTSIWFVAWGPRMPTTPLGRLKLRLSVLRARIPGAIRYLRGECDIAEWGE